VLDKIPEPALEKCALLFTKKYGWAPIFIALFLFVLFTINSVNIVNDKLLLLAVSFCVTLVFLYVLFQVLYPPIFQNKNQIGFLLAIRTESKEARDRLNTDLKDALLSSLANISSSVPFDVRVLQPFHANNVVDRDIATHYAKKSKARFVLFGSLVQRKINGEDNFILQVQALVTHGITTAENQSTLSNEMSAVLPSKASIAAGNELEEFELAGHLFGLGSQYVVSIALFFSGNRTAAIYSLSDLHKKLQRHEIARDWPGTKTLRTLVPKRLLDFQVISLNEEFFRWRNDHLASRLEIVESYFDKLPEEWKKDPRYLNIRAVMHFVLSKNIQAARELIKKVGSIEPDFAGWRYSLAFLDAYEGNTAKARSQYTKAFKFDSTAEVSIEVEEFLMWVVDTNKEKCQLVFFLGLLNFYKKKDYSSALRDFQLFLQSPNSSSFPELISEAKMLILTCPHVLETTEIQFPDASLAA
jgi:tetratricopeptide (TPR) repeat protein